MLLGDAFDAVLHRTFTAVEARTVINYTAYVARHDGLHADLHVGLDTPWHPYDEHVADLPQYDERARHSMFANLDEAAAALAAGLNTPAGEEALFDLILFAGRVTLYSRSACHGAPQMILRHATAVMGVRAGTMTRREQTLWVTFVLTAHRGHAALVTGYPVDQPSPGRPQPAAGQDIHERNHVVTMFPAQA
jgi:hypothetical protein